MGLPRTIPFEPVEPAASDQSPVRLDHGDPDDRDEREAAIKIEQLGKRYRIGRRFGPVPVPSLLPRRWRRHDRDRDKKAQDLDRDADVSDDDDDEMADEPEVEESDDVQRPVSREIWALRDVSLEIAPGTSLGIIGSDGAGKSTLLKILARITPPTCGRVLVRGRVAPLFAVAGAFMEPESTGRENVFLLADLFGAPRDVASRRVDEILSFAELGPLGDEPLKRCSDGMARRLAFSVVLNLEPDILLADGMLAVGDRGFRARCLRRVKEATEAGVTLLFASHDLDAIRRLCPEAIWMEKGRVVEQGEAGAVIERYERASGASSPVGIPAADGAMAARRDPSAVGEQACEPAVIVSAAIFSMGGEPVQVLSTREDALIEVGLDAVPPRAELLCVVALAAAGAPIVRLVQPRPFRAIAPGPYTISAHLPCNILRDAQYRVRVEVQVGLAGGQRTSIVRSDAFLLDVYDAEDAELEDEHEQEDGVAPQLAWDLSRGLPGSG